MPEGSMLLGWAHMLEKTERARLQPDVPVAACFEFFPRCFAVGTTKGYETLTCHVTTDYVSSDDSESRNADEAVQPSECDKRRAAKQPWEYLLKPRRCGPLVSAAYGKILAVAAGKHLVVFNFGLEAGMVKLSTAQYKELVAPTQDIPGANTDPQLASEMRSFLVPDSFKDKQSRNCDEKRGLNVFVAIRCSNDHVYIFCDHSRLIRMEVFSQAVPWTANDLRLESEIWARAFNGKYGPSLFQEIERPLQRMDAWRDKLRLQALTKKGGARAMKTPLADVICSDMHTFNGFGKHTTADALHLAVMLPYTPVGELVHNDVLWVRLTRSLVNLCAQFKTGQYTARVASHTTAANPLRYQTHAHNTYITKHTQVYRRQQVKVDFDVWTDFRRAGLHDPMHTIDDDYDCPPEALKSKEVNQKKMMVFAHYRPDHTPRAAADSEDQKRRLTGKKYFSCIVAAPRPEWGVERWPIVPVNVDVIAEGAKTTLGPASIAHYTVNITHLPDSKAGRAKGIPGRRAKEYTGAVGKPCYSRKTVAEQSKQANRGKHVVYSAMLLQNIEESFRIYRAKVNVFHPDTFNITHFLPVLDEIANSTTGLSVKEKGEITATRARTSPQRIEEPPQEPHDIDDVAATGDTTRTYDQKRELPARPVMCSAAHATERRGAKPRVTSSIVNPYNRIFAVASTARKVLNTTSHIPKLPHQQPHVRKISSARCMQQSQSFTRQPSTSLMGKVKVKGQNPFLRHPPTKPPTPFPTSHTVAKPTQEVKTALPAFTASVLYRLGMETAGQAKRRYAL